MIEVARAINHFASEQQQADSVPQQDQLITLTYGQLAESSGAAVHQALQDAQQDQIPTAQDVQDLRDEIEALKRELSKVAGHASDALDDVQVAFDTMNEQSKVINQLTHKVRLTPPPKVAATTEGKLQKLDTLLLARSEPVSFSEVGRILELGSKGKGKNTRRQAMTKLGHIIESHPDRYIVRKSDHSNQKFISLVPAYRQHLMRKSRV